MNARKSSADAAMARYLKRRQSKIKRVVVSGYRGMSKAAKEALDVADILKKRI